MLQCLAQQWYGCERSVVVFDVGMPSGRAHVYTAVISADAVEAADSIDVDQVGRRGQPHRHQRHQALPAGQDLPL